MTRDNSIDCLRGWAIFLVVWGHSIQYFGEGLDVLSQPIGKLIYMFHMPLFFFISGYFPRSMEHDSWIFFIKKKLLRLVVPTIIWAAIGFILIILITLPSWSFLIFIKKLLGSLVFSYWFINVLLMCLFYGKFLNSFSSKLRLPKYYVLLGGTIFLFFIPEVSILSSNIKSMKCFFPFFALGWMTKEKHLFEYFYSSKKLIAALVICCISMGIGGGFIKAVSGLCMGWRLIW